RGLRGGPTSPDCAIPKRSARSRRRVPRLRQITRSRAGSAEHGIGRDAASLRRRAWMAAEDLNAAVVLPRKIAGEYGAHRPAIAQIEDPEQSGLTRRQRQRRRGIDDDRSCPMRSDLDMMPRMTAREPVG